MPQKNTLTSGNGQREYIGQRKKNTESVKTQKNFYTLRNTFLPETDVSNILKQPTRLVILSKKPKNVYGLW